MKFKTKIVYGKPKFYPACASSRALVKLMGRVCLSKEHLEGVIELSETVGFDIEFEAVEVPIVEIPKREKVDA